MSTVEYLDESRIIAAEKGHAPAFYSATGYGRKIPTEWKIRLDDNRTRRVYSICYSNAASAYILDKGNMLFINGDCEQRAEDFNGLGLPLDPFKLDEFTRAYITAALWSSNDESDESGGEPFDANYDMTDIAPVALARMAADCIEFQRQNAAALALAYENENYCASDGSGPVEMAGHDFWLTRCGHGAGFWDRGLGEVGDTLSAVCRKWGNVDLYLGDDGKIYA